MFIRRRVRLNKIFVVVSKVKFRSLRGVYPDLSGKQSIDFALIIRSLRYARDDKTTFETASFIITFPAGS